MPKAAKVINSSWCRDERTRQILILLKQKQKQQYITYSPNTQRNLYDRDITRNYGERNGLCTESIEITDDPYGK